MRKKITFDISSADDMDTGDIADECVILARCYSASVPAVLADATAVYACDDTSLSIFARAFVKTAPEHVEELIQKLQDTLVAQHPETVKRE